MNTHATTHGGRQRLSRPRRWCQRGVRTAALSLTLAAGAASTLAAAPVQAADNYAITATIPAGAYPAQVAFSPDGTHAYLTHWAAPGSPDQGVTNTVSVISTATRHVTATIGVGSHPYGVAVSPYGAHAYVTNVSAGSVSVINTATNAVTASITVGSAPNAVAVSPGGTRAYVTNYGSSSVSVISTTTNAVTATVGAVFHPAAVAVSPDGTSVYVTSPLVSGNGAGTVSVISTATNHVTTTTRGLCVPYGVAASPDGTHIYVTSNMYRGTVSVITRQ